MFVLFIRPILECACIVACDLYLSVRGRKLLPSEIHADNSLYALFEGFSDEFSVTCFMLNQIFV